MSWLGAVIAVSLVCVGLGSAKAWVLACLPPPVIGLIGALHYLGGDTPHEVTSFFTFVVGALGCVATVVSVSLRSHRLQVPPRRDAGR